MSSRPLIDHICAICGGLLQPGFGCYSSIEQTGRAGIPSQVRGQRCAWDALPPFMLLFSKRLLARRLPSIFEITEDERLLLKTSATQLPWLHYKSRRAANKNAPTGRSQETYEYLLDMSNSWWYCRTCFRYHHKKQTFCRVLVE